MLNRWLAQLRDWYSNNDAIRLVGENLDLIQQKNELEEELRECRAVQDELQRDNLRLQDRCEVLEGDRKEMWAMIRECQAAERAVHRSNENVYWQEKGYGIRWTDAPSIQRAAEPHHVPTPGTGSRQLPSDVERQKTRAFVKAYTDKMAQDLAHATE